MFDVIIVGAGPAGTAAAYDLLEQGLSVLVLDKYEFPRKKACAGGITVKGYNLFRYDISSQVKRECSTLLIRSKHHPYIKLKYDQTLCYMTKREELDLFSLNKVMEKGGLFQVVDKINSIEQTSSFVEIKTSSGNFKASYLIGADGTNSRVRRFVTKKAFFRKQFALEGDLKVNNPQDFFMEFDFSFFRNGYFWIFPKDDCLNVGIYTVDSKKKPDTGLLCDIATSKLKTASSRLHSIKGYPICTRGYYYKQQSDRILLVGDAAGFAEKLFGEGIAFAVNSGQKAAEAIVHFFKNPEHVNIQYNCLARSLKNDLRFYDYSAEFFYRFQNLSFKILSQPYLRKHFVKGYGSGISLSRMILGTKISRAIERF